MAYRKSFNVFAIGAFTVFFLLTAAYAGDVTDYSTSPTFRKAKWRIGYLEGGHYNNYVKTLVTFVKGLKEIGWMNKEDFSFLDKYNKSAEIWAQLSDPGISDYIEFVGDAFRSSGWDDKLRKENKEAVIKRLNEKQDIDLMIAMGTWAGIDLANNLHHTPTIVCSASQPVTSGIIKSIKDSGYDHIHAHVDPNRFEKQLRAFNDLVGFKKLGVTYEDTISGRSHAALDVMEKLSSDLDFQVVKGAMMAGTDVRDAEAELIATVERIAPQIDAFYLTEHTGVTEKSLPVIVSILNEYKVPSFSQSGAEDVKKGILLSVAHASFDYVGRFHAKTVAAIFNGAKPRELNQVFEHPPLIAVNTETARIIGFENHINKMILDIADEVYQEVPAGN